MDDTGGTNHALLTGTEHGAGVDALDVPTSRGPDLTPKTLHELAGCGIGGRLASLAMREQAREKAGARERPAGAHQAAHAQPES